MKKQDAFAERQTYEIFAFIMNDQIIGIPTITENDDDIFKYCFGEEYKLDDFPNWEQAKKHANLTLQNIKSAQKWRLSVQRHIFRLQKLSDAITQKLITNGEQTEKYVSKLRRAKILLDRYNELEVAYSDIRQVLIAIYKEDVATLEKFFQRNNGERLRIARCRKKLSQEQVAALLGMSAGGYGAYERGDRDIPTFIIFQLTKILDMTADQLLGITT